MYPWFNKYPWFKNNVHLTIIIKIYSFNNLVSFLHLRETRNTLQMSFLLIIIAFLPAVSETVDLYIGVPDFEDLPLWQTKVMSSGFCETII